MEKIGVFQIEGQFTLSGRGVIIIGQIAEGVIKAGSFLAIELDGKTIGLQINSIDFMDTNGRKVTKVGLGFTFKDQKDEQTLLSKKIKPQMAVVYA